MDIIHEICSKSNTKATFFILGWIAEKYPEIVKELMQDLSQARTINPFFQLFSGEK